MKKILVIFCYFAFAINSVSAEQDGCAAYLAEAYARQGVVPKVDYDGKVSALFLYGEGTFVLPTPGLVSAARLEAELSAKRSLAEWLGVELDAESLAEMTLNQSSTTASNGDSLGSVSEFTKMIDTMRSKTDQTLSSVIKLDECMDSELGVVLVTMGWKPGLMIGRTDEETTELQAGREKAATGEFSETSITIKSVTVNGIGETESDAIRDGLRSAVSQVFGEKFASSITTSGASISLTLADSSGFSKAVATDSKITESVSKSETSGLIKSYSVIDLKFSGQKTAVILNVDLPIYQSRIVDERARIIVLPPRLENESVDRSLFNTLSKVMHRELERLLNQTKALSVLDRTNTSSLDEEIDLMSGREFNQNEAARFGNRLGADYILISEVTSLEKKKVEVELTGRNIERYTFSGIVWVKALEAATGSLVFVERVPMELTMRAEADGFDVFALRHSQVAGLTIAETLGGGLFESAFASLLDHQAVVDTYTTASERISRDRDSLRQSVEKEW
jgi:hypothetical protein